MDYAIPWDFNRQDDGGHEDCENAAEKISKIVLAAEIFQSEKHTEVGKVYWDGNPKPVVDIENGKLFVNDFLDGDTVAGKLELVRAVEPKDYNACRD